MPTQLRNLDVRFVSLVDRAAVRDPNNPTEPQKFILFKRDSGADPDPQGGSMTEEERAALQKAEQERDEALAKLEKAEKKLKKQAKTDEPTTEEIDKADLPKAVRDALEKAETERDELKKAADEATQLAKAERDQRIAKEFIAKAEGEFAHVGGDSTEFGPILKAASEKLSKEEYEALETRLRAAEEQVRTSQLFKEMGRSGDPAPAGEGDQDLARKAEELRKNDSSLTPYQAMEQALRQSRELQRQYHANAR